MRLDQEAGEFVKFQQGFQCPDKPMTPDGKFYIQVVGDQEVVLVPKGHPLLDDEPSVDEATLERWAEELYETRITI